MRVDGVRPLTGEMVDTDLPEFPEFVRYSPETWKRIYGESEEPVYSDELIGELEKAYQFYKGGAK
jgi:hypothetical protein